MLFDKQSILNLVAERLGVGRKTDDAARQLPDQVDHEQHGGILEQFGINPAALLGGVGRGGSGERGQNPPRPDEPGSGAGRPARWV